MSWCIMSDPCKNWSKFIEYTYTYAYTHMCAWTYAVSAVRDSKFLANVYIVCSLASDCYFGFFIHLIHRRVMNDIITIDLSYRRWCCSCCCCCYYLCANQVFVYCAQSRSFNRLLFVHTVIRNIAHKRNLEQLKLQRWKNCESRVLTFLEVLIQLVITAI